MSPRVVLASVAAALILATPAGAQTARATRRNWDGGRYDEMRELLASAAR